MHLPEFTTKKKESVVLTVLGTNFILTPHIKEMSRLANKTTDEIKNDMSYFVAAQAYCTVVFKGCKDSCRRGKGC